MNEESPSVWQQDKKGEWKLYFNTDIKPNSSSKKNPEVNKTITNNNILGKKLVLGTLVMTKKGIGRLIKINQEIANIRFKEDIKEEQFNINEISNNFNCFIYDYSDGNTNIIKLKLNVLGKIEDIFEKLEKIKKINRNECNYSLIFKGKLLIKDYTYEQIDLLNNSKFLLLKEQKIKYTVSRYAAVSQYWFISSLDGICFSTSQKIKLIGIGLYGSHENKISSLDGICFSTSQKIKLIGIGLYGSHENKIIDSTIKILEGSEITDKIILEENIEVSPAINKFYPISQIYFSKPLICKQNQDYCILLNSKKSTNAYYGRQGKSFVEGEKGVDFTFKRIPGRLSKTSVEVGNFPELYYYIN